jgi:hypothetical protein
MKIGTWCDPGKRAEIVSTGCGLEARNEKWGRQPGPSKVMETFGRLISEIPTTEAFARSRFQQIFSRFMAEKFGVRASLARRRFGGAPRSDSHRPSCAAPALPTGKGSKDSM